MMLTFDAIIIGAGQAGPPLAEAFAIAGMRVALIERGPLGGTCINDGCTPTKTMVASARVAHVARDAERFGVLTGPILIDMAAIVARKNAIIEASRVNLATWLASIDNLTVIHGAASFVNCTTIKVDDDLLLTAPRIFINTGGSPVVPNWSGLDAITPLTNQTIMELERVPAHLIVVGGSYIGLEFAQMFRRFGSRVTVVESASRLIAREDADVSDAVRGILEAEGITVHCDVTDCLVFNVEGSVLLGFRSADQPYTVHASELLLAVGRSPNVASLDVAAAGIAQDDRGFIVVDDQLRTSVPGIWALGDVNGRGAFTHTSYNDFEIVSDNILHGASRSVTDRVRGYALFTDPPLARAGMTETEVRATGRKALISTTPMVRVGRARERGETRGFLKVLVDYHSHQILGATLLGIEADEVIHIFLNAMSAGTPCTKLMDSVPVHPTVSELIPTLLSRLRPLE